MDFIAKYRRADAIDKQDLRVRFCRPALVLNPSSRWRNERGFFRERVNKEIVFLFLAKQYPVSVVYLVSSQLFYFLSKRLGVLKF